MVSWVFNVHCPRLVPKRTFTSRARTHESCSRRGVKMQVSVQSATSPNSGAHNDGLRLPTNSIMKHNAVILVKKVARRGMRVHYFAKASFSYEYRACSLPTVHIDQNQYHSNVTAYAFSFIMRLLISTNQNTCIFLVYMGG